MANLIPMNEAEVVSDVIPMEDAEVVQPKTKVPISDDPLTKTGVALGETVAGGVGDITNTAISGVYGLARATGAKFAGASFIDTFKEEFDNSFAGLQKAVPYTPETPEGQLMLEGMANLFMKGVQAIGDFAFSLPSSTKNAVLLGSALGPVGAVAGAVIQKTGSGKESPILGAGAQALATLATLGVGAKSIKGGKPKPPKPGEMKDVEKQAYENWDDPTYVSKWAMENYPETVKNLQASAVGKVMLAEVKSVDVYTKIHSTLNGELGLKDGGGKSLTEKMNLYMDKIDPQQTVPPIARTRIIDSTLSQLDQLNRVANMNKSLRELVGTRLIRPKQTMKQIIERQVKLPPSAADSTARAKDFAAALKEKHGYVIDPVTQVERPLTAGEYLDMQARAREARPPTAKEIVQKRTIQPTQDVVAVIEELTGVKAKAGITAKDVTAALKEPSGIWVIDPAKGQVERQLSVGEYYEIVQKGQEAELNTFGTRVSPKINEAFDALDAKDAKFSKDKFEPGQKGGPKGRLGGKQSGVIFNDLDQAVANNAKALQDLAKKSPTITAAGMLTDARYKEIIGAMDAGRFHDPNRTLSLPRHAKEQFQTKILDTAGPMKSKLEDLGPLGEAAKMRFNLIKGAPGAAQLTYNEYAKGIYKGLSHNDTIWLDRLNRARRIVAIDQYKGLGKVQHLARSNGAEMEAFKNNMLAEIGAERFDKINQASDAHFRAYQDQLRVLNKEGLLSDDGFLSMLNLEFTQTEALKYIDPERQFTFHGKTITVRDSGIAELGKGQIDPVRMNSKDLLAEHVLRVQTRVMKNKANQALHKMAQENPDNELVKIAPVKSWERGEAKGVPNTPDGYSRIDTVIEGNQHPMWVRDDIAEGWVTRPTVMTKEFSNFLSVASGTAGVKTLATTINPAFAVVNIPRDLMHIWVASREYNAMAPIAALQMGRDMAAVASDAILRRGEWTEFVKEGGSQEYLSQQGPAAFMGSQVHKMTSAWRPVYNALSYVGATSEAWTRLALRKRAIKNGKATWEASAAAREYLDFSDGGSWVKGLDSVVPYLNASTQALHTVGKQAGKTPGRVGAQALQIFGASVGMTLALETINPEASAQIPQEVKLKGYNIAPKDMFILDPQGNKRHVYFHLAMDGSWIPLHALGMSLVERTTTGKIPDGRTMDAFKELSPLLAGMPIPTITAFGTYASNYDFWLDSPVWRGGMVNPEDEIVEAGKPNATPELWKQFGEVTGMSPVRSQAAVKALAPGNPYTDVMGGSYQYWMMGASEADKAKMTWQMIAENPVLRRVVKLTHPFTAEVEALEKAERDHNSVIGKQSRTMNEMVFNVNVRQDTSFEQKREQVKDLAKAWISTQPGEDRERLVRDVTDRFAVDTVFRRLKASDGIPSQTWWRSTARMDPTVRGDVFYWQWVSRDQAGRDQMMRVAGALGQVGMSYRSDDFERSFGKQVSQWGTDKR